MPPVTRSAAAAKAGPSKSRPKNTTVLALKQASTPTPKPTPDLTSKRKFGRVASNQTRINFSPNVDSSISPSTITTVLSQYELLEVIAANLSSADVIHLAATNKEHHKYILGSKPLYERFRKRTICDGTGIRSRAHVFGHWNSDPSKADVECLEADATPCTSCQAMVCENCCYHVTYSTDSPEHAQTCSRRCAEMAWCDSVQDYCEDAMEGLHPYPDSSVFPIETLKAVELSRNSRFRFYCSDCKPNKDMSTIEWADFIRGDMCENVCFCYSMGDYVTSNLRHMCLPCFFVMEAKRYRTRNERQISVYRENPRPDGLSPLIRVSRKKEALCDCGKMAEELRLQATCRGCEGFIDPFALFSQEAW